MMYILTFLLLFFLGMVIAGWLITHKIKAKVQQMTEQMKQQMGGNYDAGQNEDTSNRRTTTPSGEEIIDMRDPKKVKQKIFKSDEGEYVDYQEESN